jgi:hypothetical protein
MSAIPQLPRSDVWAIVSLDYERLDDRFRTRGTFAPSVHAHVRRTPATIVNARPQEIPT